LPVQAVKTSTTPGFGLRGVGPKTAALLARLDIHSPQDLLFHLPFRYQDRTQVQLIRQLRPGDEAVIEGVIQSVSNPVKGKTRLLCELNDGTGRVWLRFFHLYASQSNTLTVGARLRCYHTVRLGPKGLEMVHPEFKIISEGRPIAEEKSLTPFYPATEGLSQHQLRKLTSNALLWMNHPQSIPELLPQPLLASFGFPSIQEAIRFVHRPDANTSVQVLMENKTLPQQRLVFEELLAHRLSLLKIKQEFQSQAGVPLENDGILSTAFLQQLPFELTAAQQRVLNDIRHDLNQSRPMLRLVQGDVGSGKTVVAALAMLHAVENGYQAAMMAPTELLAEQHFRVFRRWLEPLGVNVSYLSGNVKGASRKKVLGDIANGAAQVVIGTHALFQEQVRFHKLALIVVDEQHRFGVHQRALFRDKGMRHTFYPHQLVMTATPIPRTLAMSFYADLDCSSIDELPPGRTPITTTVLAASRRDEIIERIQNICQQGRQVYWVCPLINESEIISAQAAVSLYEQLQQALPNIQTGLVHGRMRADDKEAVMQDFQKGDIQLLVATTVIEVGVDVPNASLMVIENAERLGLSQLHQLRGRVGRGAAASHCVLLYDYPFSNLAKERLSVMRSTTDGFKIAQRDLELRSPGEVLGTRQTGDLSFCIADLLRDSELLPKVNQAADLMLCEYPSLIEPLIKRWLGREAEYAKV